MKRIRRIGLFVFALLLFASSIPASMTVSAAVDPEIEWERSLINGRNIYYYVDPANTYTATIPAAVQEVMYPAAGFTNRLVLTKTTNWNSSVMDFYEEYDIYGGIARAETYRSYNVKMFPYEKDLYDWLYCQIYFNEPRMGIGATVDGRPVDFEMRKGIAVHEMLHVYGLKDTYLDSRKGSIMHGHTDVRTATGVTGDANNVLNRKYP